MTVEEMQEKINRYCEVFECKGCPLGKIMTIDKDCAEGTEEELKERCEIIDKQIQFLRTVQERVSKLELENTEEVREVEKSFYQLQLTKSHVENLMYFIEMNLLDDIRSDPEADNLEYFCDMCEIYRKLKREVENES